MENFSKKHSPFRTCCCLFITIKQKIGSLNKCILFFLRNEESFRKTFSAFLCTNHRAGIRDHLPFRVKVSELTSASLFQGTETATSGGVFLCVLASLFRSHLITTSTCLLVFSGSSSAREQLQLEAHQ